MERRLERGQDVPARRHGLNTYETVALVYQRHDLTVFFGEAHNDYLELAAGGLLVGVPIVLTLSIFVRDVRRGMRDEPGSDAWWLRRGAVTGLVAIALQEMVDFSLQMPGNAALFAVLCGVALHKPRPSTVHPESGRPRRDDRVPAHKGPAYTYNVA